MAWKPKPPCRVCRRLGCTIPSHQPKPRQRPDSSLTRPDYQSNAQRSRRKATVDAWLAQHGFLAADGGLLARCPECRLVRGRFVADHVVPLAMGGTEDGELRVHCHTCSCRQGAQIVNSKRRRM